MVTFDVVMAFVALVSFVAGFYCSHQIKSQKQGYNKSFSGTRKKNRKDYVRIEDRENYEYEQTTTKRTNTKNSKFDVLLNYFSEKKSKKHARMPAQQPYMAASAAVASQDPYAFKRTAAPLYPKTEPDKRDFLPETPAAVSAQPVAAPVMPAQKSDEVRKKEKSGDEWVPMGFFED